MVKTQLKIVRFKDAAKYTGFFTSNGWMNCFDSEITADLKKCVERTVSVEVEAKKSKDKVFHNITKFYGLITETQALADNVAKAAVQAKEQVKEQVKAVIVVPNNAKVSIEVGTSVSYAKDVICAQIKAGVQPQDRYDLKGLSKKFLDIQRELNSP